MWVGHLERVFITQTASVIAVLEAGLLRQPDKLRTFFPPGRTMHPSLKTVQQQLDECLLKDRPALSRQLRFIDQRLQTSKPADKALKKFEDAVARSSAVVAQRRADLPTPMFPDELPVAARRTDIADAIEQHQVVIVAGETGSGKTTQLPKICLSLGRGVRGMIGCSQPRRVAARTIAARIADELQSPLGAAVGYQVRFQDKVSDESVIKLMTDGILLAETQHDRDLLAYDTLIIDEAHERSLNIDFLLGYVKQLLPRRPDLKVIITSATIDTERFSRHFDNAPVIAVAGRTYPVEVVYRPAADEEDVEVDLTQQVVAVVDEITRDDPRGDILVFLPGEREIRDVDETLSKQSYRHTEIVPLFARLSAQQQQKVFQPGQQRRIVLATNVAETSVTVPGIRYVIDPGTARISRYSHRSKVQLLPIEPIAQSSANQRKGRCGRVAAGVCYRLYSEEDFLSRPEFTEPEILRSSLAGVILRMKSLGFGDVETFPFVDPPAQKMIRDGQNLLSELGALDAGHRLTVVGRQMAHLPVDPRLSRMLIEANQQRSLSEVLILVAALSIQDPRERPLDAQQKADTAHGAFRDAKSDFSVLLNIWTAYRQEKETLSRNQLQHWCRKHYLSAMRMREWEDLQRQLKQILGDAGRGGKGFHFNNEPAHYDAIHRALLSGLLGNIGLKSDGNEYLGARGIRFHIFPGSGQFKKKPKWVMAGELLETTRLFARNVADIEPEWVENAAGDRLKTQCAEPHWQRKTARVMAYETGTVYGLPVYSRRLVDYGQSNPVEARELFIRAALVDGDWRTKAPFFVHNQSVLQSIVELEHKSRRQDVLVDEGVLFEFYDQRIGDTAVSGAQFEKWRKKAEAENPKCLFFDRDELMRHGAVSVTEQAYPPTLLIGGVEYPLSYRFEPGHAEDGITVTVPVLALAQLRAEALEWLVPGFLAEKVELMLKALPKDVRRAIFPIGETAQRCAETIEPFTDSLARAVCQYLTDRFRVRPQPDDLKNVSLPDHLRMTVRVVDGDGKALASGRDLRVLQRRFDHTSDQPSAAFPPASLESYSRHDIVRWDFGDLPEQQEVTVGNHTVMVYPSLVDAGRSVSLLLQTTSQKAVDATRLGINRLFQLQLSKEDKRLRQLPVFEPTVALRFRAIGSVEFLKDQFVFAVMDRVFLAGQAPLRSKADFDERLTAARGRVAEAGRQLSDQLIDVIEVYHRVQSQLGQLPSANRAVADDIEQQLQAMLPGDFLINVPAQWLAHYPRYLQAIEVRLDKCQRAASKDAENSALVASYWQRFVDKQQDDTVDRDALVTYRWMIEEFRVSLFAQQLKTAMPISAKRLDKQWELVIRQIVSK